jgi:hypothetical protein
MEEKNRDDNIVSLAEARKRQKVVRKGANGKDPAQEPGKKTPGSKIWFYIQFVLFLLVLGYFMQKCRG